MSKRTYIIAEIAQGYEGDLNLCKRFVKLAKVSQADAVKFQIFAPEELCTPSYKYYDLFCDLQLPPEAWREVIDLANELGIDFYADIFGTQTLEWITQMPIKGVKIHASDIKNHRFLKELRNVEKDLLLGVGGSTLDEIRACVEIFEGKKLTILSGFQAEPNLIEDIELHKLMILKKEFGLPVGYADHIEPDNLLTLALPAMAVLKGADVIEKHLTMERDDLQLEDYISALNPNEFRDMVKLIRSTEQFPDPDAAEFALTDREKTYRKSSKKVILSSREIPEGTVISQSDVTFLRTGEAYDELLDLEEIIGKTTTTNLQAHQLIRKEHLA